MTRLQLYHHTFRPWRVDGDQRIVASETAWKTPAHLNRVAAKFGTRYRLRVDVDVFEGWAGPMVDAVGNVLDSQRSRPMTATAASSYNPLTMSDVRCRLFALIDATPHIDWVVPTKWPENACRMMPGVWCGSSSCRLRPESGQWNNGPCRCKREPRHRANFWIGTYVENQAAADECVSHLFKVPAAVRFLSCDPLLGRVLMPYCPTGPMLDWVIVGGESGRGARPCHPDWVRSIRDQCVAAGVPFFFKQWGEWLPHSQTQYRGAHYSVKLHKFDDDNLASRVGKRAAGRLLDGRTWDEFPKGVTT